MRLDLQRHRMNRDGLHRVIEHSLAAALLVLVPSLWLGRSVWRAPLPAILIIAGFAAAYFICAMVLTWRRPSDAPMNLRRVLLGGTTAFGVAFILLAFAQWQWSDAAVTDLPRMVPFTSFALGMASLVGLLLIRDAIGRKLLILVPALLVAFMGHFAYKLQWLPRPSPPTREVTYVDTSLYVLKRTSYRNWFPGRKRNGGGIAAFGDGYLLFTADGRLFFVREKDDRTSLKIQQLNYHVPVNPDDFERGVRAIFGESPAERKKVLPLRIGDLLVRQTSDDSFQLFVSHHFWRAQEACFVVRVSVLQGSRHDLLDPSGKLAWQTLYETTPCLTLNVHGHRGVRFASLEMGGAMALLSENELLLTVGDHEFDGWNRDVALAQDPASSYGKIMLIRLDTGQSEIYSLGHRNPQGLHVDSAGVVWSTEHGPRGGDELNRIRRGANYGWPLATYGTDYRLHRWPPNPAPGRHEGFEKPVLAFVPSIAVSGLKEVTGTLFESWRGDFVLPSFKGDLRRVRIEDGRAIVTEPIPIGARIRDIAQGPDGRLLLWTDARDLIFLEPADGGSAEVLVFQCTGCHTLKKWENASIGPNLFGVVGSRTGAAQDFEYSQAMLDFGGRWTKERLDAFIANPRATVPGTTMQFDGISDASQRAQLIEYLERLR
jgi:cytochrome c2